MNGEPPRRHRGKRLCPHKAFALIYRKFFSAAALFAAIMNPFLLNKSIDLVDFDDLKLFMFKDDNLYNIAVADNRKNQSVEDYQKFVAQNGFPPAPLTPANIGDEQSARRGVYLFLYHLWQRDVSFTVLDIGSHIGDFSLKTGNFIRTFKKNNQVVSFDPTEAGALVGYNIKLNGLEAIVSHENLAVADFDGVMLFSYSPGFSDSSHLASRDAAPARRGKNRVEHFLQKSFKEKVESVRWNVTSRVNRIFRQAEEIPSYNLIVEGVDVINYLHEKKITGNLFVKLDIEGFDSVVINRLAELLPGRLIWLIFEFNVKSFGGQESAAAYLGEMQNSFYLFDLFYSPNPTRFRLIESADKLREFVSDITERKYGYTDIFALDKRTPDCDALVGKLSGLTESADDMTL